MCLFCICGAESSICISLADGGDYANTESFQGSVQSLLRLCSLSVPKGGGMWGIFRKPSKRAIRNTLGLHVVLTTCLRFLSILDGACDFWDVSKWLAGAYKSSGSHLDHLQAPVLIRDDKIKWLDFGVTPDPQNLQPHPGLGLGLGEVRVQ